jgi:predicted RNase H-like HicB family nuclease
MAHEASIRTRAYTYTALLEPDEDGGFVVTCPALPGLVTHGDSLEQAREHAAEAIELYLECLPAEGSANPRRGRVPRRYPRREPITVKLSYSA